ncbi:MAG TPA: TrkH family potassium uptake protein [Methanocorpusculum sp.]|nr:TrkH family potassium uptake protein [Methanocorpusculum sp.]
MEFFRELAALGRDLGPGLALIGAVSLIPLIVTVIYQEWGMVFWMLIPALILGGTGLLLRFVVPKTDKRPRAGLSIAATAFLWVVVALICGIPFLSTGISYADAIFESMSALTCTGFSVVPDFESWPHTLLFLRSFMQWLGGIGIVAFTLVVASRSGLVARGLYRSEGRTESFMPSVIATAFQMWKIYAILTGISLILIMLTGVSLWEGVNLALCAISTGGMSIYADGVAHFANHGLEMVLIPVMIAGAIPFRLYYLTFIHKSPKEILHDSVFRLILGVFAVVSAFVLIELLVCGYGISDALYEALFMTASAVSSTGFQCTDFASWSPVPLFIFMLFILIGGAQGSTAGGLKLDRVRILFETLFWWFKMTLLSPRAVLNLKHGERMVKRSEASKLVSRPLMLIILFIMLIVATLVVLLHDPYFSANVYATIFDVFSCAGNNGCSLGVIGPAMPDYANYIIFLVMWVARLEIIPVLILIWGIIRGFNWEAVTKRR